MRTRTTILTLALLLASSGFALAQDQPSNNTNPSASDPAAATTTAPAKTPTLGLLDFGIRSDSVKGDAARYNRFRDVRDGLFLERFRFEKETPLWFFNANAKNLGYRDQQFAASYENIGKLTVDFDWTQTPLFISQDTRWLYSDNGNGVLSIDDSVQRAIQNATALGNAARDQAIASAFSQARQYDLRSKRSVGLLDLVYTVNRDVDLKFSVKNGTRKGHNLMSFGFGTSPGLLPAVELGIPTDDRTTDIKGMAEFANTKGLFSVGYNASWYENALPLVQFDNPLRADSISGGTSVGQVAMWPSNSSASFFVSGGYKLAPRTRANAFISIGRANQDERLAPATVNTALVAPPLERATTQGRADVVSANFNFTSRPINSLFLNARYRYYDYANKTHPFDTTTLIGDWTVGTALWENEPNSFKRKTFDFDASYTPFDYVAFGVGLGREEGDRTFRIFEKTTEDMFRVSLDSTGNQYVTLRAKYEYSKRTGSGFEEELLDEVGEQPETRHFDVADRKRERVTGILSITPISWFALNGSVGTGRDDYFETGFGLRDNKNNTYSVGFDVMPADTVTFGVNYGFEKYTANQYSRTANPLSATDTTFLDPTRDWWLDTADKVKTFTASLDLLKALPKTDIRISYDLSDGTATYVYGMKPEQKVFTAIPLTQLSPLKNKLTGAKADVQYFVRANFALGLVYWYEDYKVQDFALSSATLNRLDPVNATTGVFASTLYSGYLYRPYTANTFWLRMSYLW
jgi:MtrB/PioB family decaheme-associated outer membrane protein